MTEEHETVSLRIFMTAGELRRIRALQRSTIAFSSVEGYAHGLLIDGLRHAEDERDGWLRLAKAIADEPSDEELEDELSTLVSKQLSNNGCEIEDAIRIHEIKRLLGYEVSP